MKEKSTLMLKKWQSWYISIPPALNSRKSRFCSRSFLFKVVKVLARKMKLYQVFWQHVHTFIFYNKPIGFKKPFLLYFDAHTIYKISFQSNTVSAKTKKNLVRKLRLFANLMWVRFYDQKADTFLYFVELISKMVYIVTGN